MRKLAWTAWALAMLAVAPDLSAFKSTDKDGYEEMYRLGYEAAKEKCDEILRLIYKD